MLRKYLPFPLRSPDAAASAGGGTPGAGPAAAAPLSPLHALAQMLSEESSPGSIEPQDAPPPPAEGDPATAAPTDTAAAPGQENLTSEETPPAEGDEPKAEGESETVLPKTENAELTQALAGLSPTERKSALELVKALQPGEIPRIAKLIAGKHTAEQTIEAQAKQIEELQGKADGQNFRQDAGSTLPASMAKFKSMQDVQARLEVVENNAEALQDFLDTNPGNADTAYTIEGKEFTRQQLIERRAEFRAELKALPKRAQQLTQLAQFTQAQRTARSDMERDFPWVADAEHTETKAIAAKLKEMPLLKAAFVSPEYAAAVWVRGEKAMQAELAARKAKGNGHANPLAAGRMPALPAGKVPLGKPHAPAGNAAVRVQSEGNVKTALEDHKKDGSRNSLAALITAGGL